MTQLFLSISLLVVGIGVLFLAGLPLTQMVFYPQGQSPFSRHQNSGLWALSPFIGFSLISLFLQIFFLMNIPVHVSAWIVFPVVIVVFVVWQVLRYLPSQHNPNTRWKLPVFSTLCPSGWFMGFGVALLVLFSVAYLMTGARYYKGYGAWDNIFYGFNAEALRAYAPSSFEDMVHQQSYVGRIQPSGGYHRLGINVVTAFVAELCGVDGASGIGFITILGTMLAYFALVYCTENLDMNPVVRYGACFAGAALPGLTLDALDGFIASSLTIGFILVFVRLPYVLCENPNNKKAALAGIVFGIGFSLYNVAWIAILGLSLVAFLLYVFTRKPTKKHFMSIGLFLVFSILVNLHFIQDFSAHLGVRQAKVISLNGYYQWADKPESLAWMFFGTSLKGVEQSLFFLIQYASLLIFIAGLTGIGMAVLKDRRLEAVSMIALFLYTILFLALINKGERPLYSYYKMFTVFAALLPVGVWRCWKTVRNWFSHYVGSRWNKEPLRFKKAFMGIGSSALAIIFAITTGVSVQRTMVIPFADQFEASDDLRILSLHHEFSPEIYEFYDMLSEKENENILLLAYDNTPGYFWSAYYGRENRIYSLVESIDTIHVKVEGIERKDYRAIPNDVELLWPHEYDWEYSHFVPEEYKKDLAAVIQTRNEDEELFTMGTFHKWEPYVEEYHDEYIFTFFSREEINAVVTLVVNEAKPNTELFWDGKALAEKGTVDSGTVITIPITLPANGSRFVLECENGAFSLGDWSLEVV